MAGLIRLQWWRDALAAIESGRPPAHPVAEALATALDASPACRPHIEAAIDAREHELENPAAADLGALERQLEASGAAISRAALMILGAHDAAALEVGRKIGLVVGLADRLRSLAADRREGRMPLPATELARHGIDPQTALDVPDLRLAPVVRAIAGRGLEHLGAARAARRAVPKRALAALLPGTLAGAYLRRLRRTGSAATAPDRSPLAPLALLGCHLVGRF